MTRALLSLLSLLVLSSLAACDSAPKRADQWPLSQAELHETPPAPGELTYRRYCIGCHGADGRGNGGITGADLTAPQGPLFGKTDEQLLISVRDGKRGERATMPAHGPVLTPAQLQNVIAYVRKRFSGAPVH